MVRTESRLTSPGQRAAWDAEGQLQAEGSGQRAVDSGQRTVDSSQRAEHRG